MWLRMAASLLNGLAGSLYYHGFTSQSIHEIHGAANGSGQLRWQLRFWKKFGPKTAGIFFILKGLFLLLKGFG